jgi:hypothetical protein
MSSTRQRINTSTVHVAHQTRQHVNTINDIDASTLQLQVSASHFDSFLSYGGNKTTSLVQTKRAENIAKPEYQTSPTDQRHVTLISIHAVWPRQAPKNYCVSTQSVSTQPKSSCELPRTAKGLWRRTGAHATKSYTTGIVSVET